MLDRNTYGIYNGEVYRIGFGRNNEVILYAKQGDDKRNSRQDHASYLALPKTIKREELSEAYYMVPCAEYKGHKTFIAREVGDEYDIWVPDYAIAQELGFDRCDKYAYNKMINKADVRVFYEKHPLKL